MQRKASVKKAKDENLDLPIEIKPVEKKISSSHHEPPKPKDDSLYNILIIAMIIGIIIASVAVYYFRFYLYGKIDSFSELYFPKPDDLPNWVKLGDEYNFSFTIKSDENQSTNYTYLTKIELFNLYEDVEAKYGCLAKYRSKIYLDWTNETDNFSVINAEQRIPEISPMIVHPNFEKKISWINYTFETSLSPVSKIGSLAIYFKNETELRYSIVFDLYNNKTIFNNKPFLGADLFSGNNKIKIEVRNQTIGLYVNSKAVFTQNSKDLHDGQFGLETKDNYIVIQGFRVYKDTPVVIPDRDTIWDYSIESNQLFNRIYEIRNLRSRSISLQRKHVPWNETIDCVKEPFYCEYFDLPNDISFYLDDTNLTRVVERIPVTDEEINYKLDALDINNSAINWTEFSISFSHSTIPIGSYGAIILKFEDKWAVMITSNNSYYIRPSEGKTVIDEIRNPNNYTKYQIDAYMDSPLINVTGGNITLYINKQFIFSRNAPSDYTFGTPAVFMKNSFFNVEPLTVGNLDPLCSDQTNFMLCEIIFDTGLRRRQSTVQQNEFRIDFDDPSVEQSEEIEKINSSINETQNKNITFIRRSNINTPVYNNFIPDRRLVLNTPGTRIINSTSFGLDYTYSSLDGARIAEIGLLDLAENEIASMLIIENQNTILTTYFNGKQYVTESIYQYINKTVSHTPGFSVTEQNITFLFDNKRVKVIKHNNITSGMLYLASRNTYLELGNIHYSRGNSTRTLNFDNNPCEFKLVHSAVDNNTMQLMPGQSATLSKSFNITRDFDYGKVSVELFGSGGILSNESLEIHFWIMRDDNK
ncbi:MAG: hypothetical protein V1859_03610 [archaeon]